MKEGYRGGGEDYLIRPARKDVVLCDFTPKGGGKRIVTSDGSLDYLRNSRKEDRDIQTKGVIVDFGPKGTHNYGV